MNSSTITTRSFSKMFTVKPGTHTYNGGDVNTCDVEYGRDGVAAWVTTINPFTETRFDRIDDMPDWLADIARSELHQAGVA